MQAAQAPQTFHLYTPGPPRRGRLARALSGFCGLGGGKEGKKKLVTAPQFQATTTTLHAPRLLAPGLQIPLIRELGQVVGELIL